jgi:malonate transporter and related proteins
MPPQQAICCKAFWIDWLAKQQAFQEMTSALTAIVPVFGVIAIGFVAKRLKLVPETAWPSVNSFGYFILYPAFLFSTVSTADFTGPKTAQFLLCLLAGFTLAAAWGLSLRLAVPHNGPAFTSVFQGSVRWNGFIILAAAPALYGPEGTALVALGFGPVVAFVNLISVSVMARWGDNDVKPDIKGALGEVGRNPLVLASIAGLAANVSGLAFYMENALDAISLLGRAAMPIALVSVGAALNFGAITKAPLFLTLGVVSKLLIAPAQMLLVGYLFDLPPLLIAVCVGVASMPSAPASYVLAREMGGDAPLMAGIVTATTLLALITIPLWHRLAFVG